MTDAAHNPFDADRLAKNCRKGRPRAIAARSSFIFVAAAAAMPPLLLVAVARPTTLLEHLHVQVTCAGTCSNKSRTSPTVRYIVDLVYLVTDSEFALHAKKTHLVRYTF